jgi:hypothetical protein
MARRVEDTRKTSGLVGAACIEFSGICRTYHCPRVSPSSCSSGNVSTPSGKCPQKITACAQKLRTQFATKLQ